MSDPKVQVWGAPSAYWVITYQDRRSGDYKQKFRGRIRTYTCWREEAKRKYHQIECNAEGASWWTKLHLQWIT